MKQPIVYPEKFAIVLLWGPLFIFGLSIAVLSIFGEELIEWLFDNYPLHKARIIVLIFFGAFSSWLILNSIWFGVLGIKTYILQKYPPGKLPTPLKSKQLIGNGARKASSILLAIAFLGLLFGAAFAYSQYISNSSGL